MHGIGENNRYFKLDTDELYELGACNEFVDNLNRLKGYVLISDYERNIYPLDGKYEMTVCANTIKIIVNGESFRHMSIKEQLGCIIEIDEDGEPIREEVIEDVN